MRQGLQNLITCTFIVGASIALLPPTSANAAIARQVITTPATDNTTDSYASDGFNSTIELSTIVTQASAPDPLPASVRWSYQKTTAPQDPGFTLIAVTPIQQTVDPSATGDGNTLAFAATEWAPPGDATYSIKSELLEANQVTLIESQVRTGFTVTNAGPALHITVPPQGGFVGYYPLTGKINVSGAYPSSSWTSGQVQIGANASNAASDGNSSRWAADVLPGSDFTAPTPSSNSFVGPINVVSGAGGFAESHLGVAYRQQLTSFSSTGARSQPGLAAANHRVMIWTALDQRGNPVSGLPLKIRFGDPNNDSSYCVYQLATSDNSAPVSALGGSGAPTCGAGSTATNNSSVVPTTTDLFGRLRLDVANADEEVLEIAVATNFDGTFSPAVDFTRTNSFVTTLTAPVSGSATVSGSPTYSIYPSQTYGTAAGPRITVNLVNSSGNTIDQSQVSLPVVYSYVRRITSGQNATDSATYPRAFVPGQLNGVTDPSGNAILTPAAVAIPDGESGYDTFRIWFERDGNSGYGSGDLLLGSPVVSFGPEHLYFQPCDPANSSPGTSTCAGQQTIGIDKTLNAVASIFDGTADIPVSNRLLELTLSHFNPTVGTDSGFSAANPGILRFTPSWAQCTTNSSGECSLAVFANAVDTDSTISASDLTLGNDILSDNAADVIQFTRAPTKLTATPLLSSALHPTARLTRSDTGSPVARQTVTFTAAGHSLCTAVTNANGTATCSSSFTVLFTAVFAGSTNYVASRSPQQVL